MKDNIAYKNKKAFFEFTIEDDYIAGIVLQGTEIKSIREGAISFNDSYCAFINNELFVKHLHIAEYSFGTCNNHEPLRDKKLLLNKRELKKIKKKIELRGYTIIPTYLYVTDKGLAKLKIGVAKGKKLYDKRESLKKKDIEKSNRQLLKG